MSTPRRSALTPRVALLCLVAGLCLLAGGLRATTAQAYQQDYCGILIPSNSVIGNYNCYSSTASLTYSSASYTGGGNIYVLTAGLRGNETLSPYSTFTSLCYSTAASSRGGVRQNDNGASHTIYGHVDDSPNHTGCI